MTDNIILCVRQKCNQYQKTVSINKMFYMTVFCFSSITDIQDEISNFSYVCWFRTQNSKNVNYVL